MNEQICEKCGEKKKDISIPVFNSPCFICLNGCEDLTKKLPTITEDKIMIKREEWEERFDEKFYIFDEKRGLRIKFFRHGFSCEDNASIFGKKIIDFIRSLISEKDKRIGELENLVKRLDEVSENAEKKHKDEIMDREEQFKRMSFCNRGMAEQISELKKKLEFEINQKEMRHNAWLESQEEISSLKQKVDELKNVNDDWSKTCKNQSLEILELKQKLEEKEKELEMQLELGCCEGNHHKEWTKVMVWGGWFKQILDKVRGGE